ncbi:MAG: hypothetical protein AB1758_16745 [Candidatus Eremiobacterota bacterium]
MPDFRLIRNRGGGAVVPPPLDSLQEAGRERAASAFRLMRAKNGVYGWQLEGPRGRSFTLQLPMGLLPIPLLVHCAAGGSPTAEDPRTHRAFEVRMRADSWLEISIEPLAPRVIFHPDTLEYGLQSPARRPHATQHGDDSDNHVLMRETLTSDGVRTVDVDLSCEPVVRRGPIPLMDSPGFKVIVSGDPAPPVPAPDPPRSIQLRQHAGRWVGEADDGSQPVVVGPDSTEGRLRLHSPPTGFLQRLLGRPGPHLWTMRLFEDYPVAYLFPSLAGYPAPVAATVPPDLEPGDCVEPAEYAHELASRLLGGKQQLLQYLAPPLHTEEVRADRLFAVLSDRRPSVGVSPDHLLLTAEALRWSPNGAQLIEYFFGGDVDLEFILNHLPPRKPGSSPEEDGMAIRAQLLNLREQALAESGTGIEQAVQPGTEDTGFMPVAS